MAAMLHEQEVRVTQCSLQYLGLLLIPELHGTNAPSAKVEDQPALGHAHGVKVVAVVDFAAGEEDEAGIVAGAEGETDARVSSDAVRVDLEEAAAVEAHCLYGLDRNKK